MAVYLNQNIMFKKDITYFIIYHIKGLSNNKFSIYATLDVSTSDSSIFNEKLNELCKETHINNNIGYIDSAIVIENIQLISIQISFFKWRLF